MHMKSENYLNVMTKKIQLYKLYLCNPFSKN